MDSPFTMVYNNGKPLIRDGVYILTRNGEKYCMKTYENIDKYINEVFILIYLNKLEGFYEYDDLYNGKGLWPIMKYYEYRFELFIPKNDNELFKCIQQLIIELHILKKNNIVHGDIKLSNIRIDKNYNIKLIDYSESAFIKNNNFFKKIETTPYVNSLSNIKDYSHDIYSMGVVIANIIFETHFINYYSLNGKIYSDGKLINVNLNKDIKELLIGMLNIDKNQRIDLEKCFDLVDLIWIPFLENEIKEIDKYINEDNNINYIYNLIINDKNIDVEIDINEIFNYITSKQFKKFVLDYTSN